MRNRPVNTVDNLTPEIIDDVRRFWPNYHPRGIADFLNTKYGRTWPDRFTEHHVYNLAGIVRRLDMEASPR